jgi:hypothetical protein
MRTSASVSLALLGGIVAGIAGRQPSLAGSEHAAIRRPPLSVDEARERAELLHETIHATLHAVHRDFYREDEGLPIPAASLGKVFRALEEQQGVSLRWLAVDGEAMNVDHKARDEFERAAVKSIQDGPKPHESAEGGVYRRAAAITLTSECLKCHVPNRKSTEDRSAGLIVSMRLRGE